MKIPWDLEATPLQIKTNSALGSGDNVDLNIYDKNSTSYISYMYVIFDSKMQYMITDCIFYTDLPVQPSIEAENIWTITKTETALIIKCNDVEVLNYLFADSSNSECVPIWAGDVVEYIGFDNLDTASDFYRAGMY